MLSAIGNGVKMNFLEMDAHARMPSRPHPENFLAANAAAARTHEDCRRVRRDAISLLERGLIDAAEYAAMFGGLTCHFLTRTADGCFVDAQSGERADEVVRCYSRAKHGSMPDIKLLVQELVAAFLARLEQSGSSLQATFERANAHGDYVVLFGTGLRNVPAASNLMCDLFVEEVNMGLVVRGYPTIANVRLPRIAPPCENYASLSLAERLHVSQVQDHVLPDANFYRGNGVHVLFADDALVTGSTADKVYASAMAHGAHSFHSIYPVTVDPAVAVGNPAVEEALNTCDVGAEVDDGLLEILAAPGHVPVLRTLRLVFSGQHYQRFPDLMARLGSERVCRLYRAALNGDLNRDAKYERSLAAARSFLDLQS